jgi:hypothetical protein
MTSASGFPVLAISAWEVVRMKRVLSVAVTFIALSLGHPPEGLSAQLFGNLGVAVPGEDAVSVGVFVGQMDPQTRFRDGGGFDSSTLVGAAVSFWLNRYAGVQLSASGTKHEGLPASDGRSSIVSNRDPRIWTTMGDALVRYPLMRDGAVTLFPYAALGGGWKTYRWAFDPQGGPDARGFDLAWSYAAGVDVRFGANKRLGVRGEYRDVRTPIERWGEDLTHQDRVLVAGLMMNF